MSLRFVTGRSGTGKTTFFLEEMRREMIDRPAGSPIIYIVPEQMTFLSEYEMVRMEGVQGMIRAQVYSFTRLAWRIVQETGGAARTHVSSTGLNMLIRKIMEDHKDELKLFRKASDKRGFIQQVEQVLTEFKHYCIEPEDLAEKKEELDFFHSKKTLADKMHDLELIYRYYTEALAGKYIDSNDYLQLLAASIEKSDYLAEAEVYIDGFHSFTPQEYTVIDQLMNKCKRISVALVADRPYREENPDELDLFRMPGETYFTLHSIARESGVPVEEDIHLSEPLRFRTASLRHLEAELDRRPASSLEGETAVQMLQSANRRSEIEGIAREVRRLVMEEEYRYKDIAVLIRNEGDYQASVQTIFQDYEIPFFIDQKLSMLTHPLIELLRSVLEVIHTNWRYEPVFRAIKTDLLFPLESRTDLMREKMDRLENYVLANGIKGEGWTKKEKWVYRRLQGLELAQNVQTDEERRREDELAKSREMIVSPIFRLARKLKRAATAKELCEALYYFLEELDIPRKLEWLSDEAEKQGRLIISREHDQAWNAVMELLDQYVEILGDTKMSIEDFMVVLDAGLEEMKFSLIPPAIDQVFIADLERSRLSEVRAVFAAGLNNGVLPAKFAEDGVFSDEDRQSLQDAGMALAPDSREKLLYEEFVAYRAFTAARDRLYLSYPLADDEGKALQPSPYIEKVKEIFPDLKVLTAANEPAELTDEEQLDYVIHPNTAIAYLTGELLLKKRGYPVADFWWDVYNFYITDPAQQAKAERILSSLYYENKTKKLTRETSKELYGDHILASVSRMELFQGCPFSHFAAHGLKLRERELYRLEAPHIGDLFHAALKWIGERVTALNLRWSDLTEKQCLEMAREAVASLAPKLQNQILLSTNRHHYIRRKLEQIIARASYVMSSQAKRSLFYPVGVEIGFGPEQKLPPFSFTLKNGTKMELQGRIDRVDMAESEDGIYLRVIDYKSSARELDLTEVYYGFSLQMLTYLDMIITYSEELIGQTAMPAGVFYFHVHDPMVKSKSMLTLDDIEKEIMNSFKMNGLALDDQDVVRMMDLSLENGNSNIISAGIKKDGTLTSASKAAGKQDFDLLRNHVRNLYMDSGEAITEGHVEISPYRLQDKTPCRFCMFKPVCQFDQSLESNQYRQIDKENRKDVLARIHQEGEKE